MPEPLSPVELSELRMAVQLVTTPLRSITLRLVEEVERTREANRLFGSGCPHGGYHAPYCISCCAKFDPERMALIHEDRCKIRVHERAGMNRE